MTEFKIGDKIRYTGKGCQNTLNLLKVNDVYTVVEIYENRPRLCTSTYCLERYGITLTGEQYQSIKIAGGYINPNAPDYVSYCSDQFILANQRFPKIKRPPKPRQLGKQSGLMLPDAKAYRNMISK